MSDELKLNLSQEIRNRITANYLMQVVNPPLPVTFDSRNKLTGKPKHIIIHDSNCLNYATSALIMDGPNTAVGALKVENIVKSGYNDYNYHFIVDRIDKDYEVISGRPINMRCDHPSLDKRYQDSIHVIILCDLNIELPDNRLYKILAYRCLAPLIKMLKIGEPNGAILFHKDIETKRDVKCPGDFLARELLVSTTKRYL